MAKNKAFAVELEGLDKLKDRVKLENLSSAPLRTFYRNYGQIVSKEAKDIVPEDTGALKRSIRVKQIQSLGRLPNGITIRAFSPKAPYVHGDPKKLPGLKTAEAGQYRTKPHFPPLKALSKWGPIKAKPEILWPVALSIAKKGTPLVPFLFIAERNTKIERKALLSIASKSIEKEYAKSKRLGKGK